MKWNHISRGDRKQGRVNRVNENGCIACGSVVCGRRASMNDGTRRRGSLQSACEGTRWAANSLGSVDRVSSLPDVVSRRATRRLHSRSSRSSASKNCRARPFSCNRSRSILFKEISNSVILKKKKKTGKILNIIVHTFLRLVEDPCLIQTLVVNLNDNIKYKTNEVTVNSSKLVTIRIIANDKLLKGSKTRE